MCWMLVEEAGKELNIEYMDKAQKHNEDGYGVAWYENGYVNTYKSFNYEQFKAVCVALQGHSLVVHLRYATKGDKTYGNIHPFDTPSGVMFHNGTMYKSKPTGKESDSKALADTISECDYESIKDIMPLIRPYIDDNINRLVFFEDSGEIIIENKDLGIYAEDGTWYSNDYHLKDDSWKRTWNKHTKKKIKEIPKATVPKASNRVMVEKVFVYGTLKKGGVNHRLLKDALFLGEAKTKQKWTMIGSGYSFPYVLKRDHALGGNIVGEVYYVTKPELSRLDMLEGVPSHYKKQTIEVVHKDFKVEEVTMYTKATVGTLPANQKYITNWEV